jgi:carboxylate-amine ligase
MIDLAAARETFEGSSDFTVGIEEEFALVDPTTLELTPAFERLRPGS